MLNVWVVVTRDMPDLRWVFLVYTGERRHVAITSRGLVAFQYSMYFVSYLLGQFARSFI